MSAQRTWVRIGSYLLAGSTATLLAGQSLAEQPLPEDELDAHSLQLAGESGLAQWDRGGDRLQLAAGEGEEGGEGGGEGGALPSSYSLTSTDANAYSYDAAAEVEGYADLVFTSYRAAYQSAKEMQGVIEAFLQDPTEEKLAKARAAWIDARPTYLVTETFRFYDGPIDVDSEGGDGPEGRINAWPLNEAVIDYVEGNPDAGLINATDEPITKELILANDQVRDEADVTTGWHAIEFLLWGQDLYSDGPGRRPASDYTAGVGNNDRRRQYLSLVTEMLVEDLADLAGQWEPGRDNYRATFLALPQREAIGRIVNGMAQLAGFEMASERLAVALDSGMQEDEHSCFSDNTKNDHVYDLAGIRKVWYGQAGDQQVHGLEELVRRVDPVAAELVTARLATAEKALEALDDPFDSILASPPDSPARQKAEQAVTALEGLGEALKEAGTKLGVLVIVGG